MAKKIRNAKDVRSFVMQEVGESEYSNVKIEFEGPTVQELQDWLAGL